MPGKPDDTFVIQEHHARALHWDFRLERGGVLVSWAVPKGLPLDPATNHLAVHTEDHPLAYAGFAGGNVIAWDRGTYECEKWTEREVKVVLHGSRVSGRYVLFRTRGKDWMVHRMDPAPPGWQPTPALLRPMLATPGRLPAADEEWGYELAWDGLRAVAYVDGGRVRILLADADARNMAATFPELRALGAAMGATQAVLNGEIVCFDSAGAPSPDRLARRRRATSATEIRRLAAGAPAVFLVADLLHLDGRPLVALPYAERRQRLDGLRLAGPAWQTPPQFTGDGAAVLRASREQGLTGIVAKRLDSAYRAGERSDDWRLVTHES